MTRPRAVDPVLHPFPFRDHRTLAEVDAAERARVRRCALSAAGRKQFPAASTRRRGTILRTNGDAC